MYVCVGEYVVCIYGISLLPNVCVCSTRVCVAMYVWWGWG